MDSYIVAKQQYEALSDERNICLTQVSLSKSDKAVFIEITNVLLKMVNLPLSSILSSQELAKYTESIYLDLENLKKTVDDGFSNLDESDCPIAPIEPVQPTR